MNIFFPFFLREKLCVISQGHTQLRKVKLSLEHWPVTPDDDILSAACCLDNV
jgi:hypothetical protein